MRIIFYILVLTIFKLTLFSMVYHLIRGYSTMLGYWEDKEKTDEVRVHMYRALICDRFFLLR